MQTRKVGHSLGALVKAMLKFIALQPPRYSSRLPKHSSSWGHWRVTGQHPTGGYKWFSRKLLVFETGPYTKLTAQIGKQKSEFHLFYVRVRFAVF